VIKPRVLIIENYEPMQYVLRRIVEVDCAVVGVMADGHSALDAAERLLPDLILLDVSLPSLGGFALARQLRGRMPGVQLVFVTAHEEPAYVQEAFDCGAKAYVLKKRVAIECVEAIRQVRAGHLFKSRNLADPRE